jgi:hypothetical protein
MLLFQTKYRFRHSEPIRQKRDEHLKRCLFEAALMLHVNYEFCLNVAMRLRPGGRFLDYGCGSGQIVVAGRKRSLDIYGMTCSSEEVPRVGRQRKPLVCSEPASCR